MNINLKNVLLFAFVNEIECRQTRELPASQIFQTEDYFKSLLKQKNKFLFCYKFFNKYFKSINETQHGNTAQQHSTGLGIERNWLKFYKILKQNRIILIFY